MLWCMTKCYCAIWLFAGLSNTYLVWFCIRMSTILIPSVLSKANSCRRFTTPKWQLKQYYANLEQRNVIFMSQQHSFSRGNELPNYQLEVIFRCVFRGQNWLRWNGHVDSNACRSFLKFQKDTQHNSQTISNRSHTKSSTVVCSNVTAILANVPTIYAVPYGWSHFLGNNIYYKSFAWHARRINQTSGGPQTRQAASHCVSALNFEFSPVGYQLQHIRSGFLSVS